MMEWQQQQQQQQQIQNQQQIIHHLQNPEDGIGNGNGGLYVKVMTDEQMELLRRQIAVYATICERLVEMHKAVTAQQDITGMRLGNFYCDPFMASGGHKITARQRWTPTPVQLQMLERIFEEGTGTPCKQKIKEITMELTQHGQISETNVYNWFQNRRARSKRKQSVPAQNNGESEAEPEVESPRDEKTKPEDIMSLDNSGPRAENMYLQSPELGTEFPFVDTPSEIERIRSSSSFDIDLEILIGNMDVPLN